MANTSLRGFRWVKSIVAGPSNEPPVLPVRVASGYAQTLKLGDPITQRSTGYHEVSVGSEGTQDQIFGVVTGFGKVYNSATGRMESVNQFTKSGGVYGTNLTDLMTYVFVIPVFGQIFEVDADDATIATQANWIAAVGENADHVISGDTTDALPLLDISTHATTGTLQWRIYDVSPRIDNDVTVARTKVYVTCNKPQLAGMAATVLTAT